MRETAEREEETPNTAARRALKAALEGCQLYVNDSCDTALRSAVISAREREQALAWRGIAAAFERDQEQCKSGSAVACDAAIVSPAADAKDRERLETLKRAAGVPKAPVRIEDGRPRTNLEWLLARAQESAVSLGEKTSHTLSSASPQSVLIGVLAALLGTALLYPLLRRKQEPEPTLKGVGETTAVSREPEAIIAQADDEPVTVSAEQRAPAAESHGPLHPQEPAFKQPPRPRSPWAVAQESVNDSPWTISDRERGAAANPDASAGIERTTRHAVHELTAGISDAARRARSALRASAPAAPSPDTAQERVREGDAARVPHIYPPRHGGVGATRKVLAIVVNIFLPGFGSFLLGKWGQACSVENH